MLRCTLYNHGPSLNPIVWLDHSIDWFHALFLYCREQEQKVHDIRSNVKDVIVVSSSGTAHHGSSWVGVVIGASPTLVKLILVCLYHIMYM